MRDFKHCDDYIRDLTQPECLRAFLDYARSPAHGANREDPRPDLYADFEGVTVRITMASRFGDVGITPDLELERGYDHRVPVEDLTNFRTTPNREGIASE